MMILQIATLKFSGQLTITVVKFSAVTQEDDIKLLMTHYYHQSRKLKQEMGLKKEKKQCLGCILSHPGPSIPIIS